MNEISVFNPLGLSPTIFSIDWPIHLELRWYGVMYLTGYLVGYWLLKKLLAKRFFKIDETQLDNFVFSLAVGMVIGARIVYCLVYDYDQWIHDPISIIFINRGGLSFHGAVVGMAVAAYYFARKHGLKFLQVTDVVALAGSPGLFFGRMGNFINGELYGRVTDVPWAMIFPMGGPLPRHPSMLYEGITEGILLALLLWALLKKVKYYGQLSAVFLAGYAFFRFVVEFYRQPDEQLGFYWQFLTMGQILCLTMMIAAVFFYRAALRRAQPINLMK